MTKKMDIRGRKYFLSRFWTKKPSQNVLSSPTPVSELTLDAIMEHLMGHYQSQTIKIVKQFKFFKRNQGKTESAMEFMAKLCRLAKTCNFGGYLETAIRDQFVCGLYDSKCQKELLCQTDLTAEGALQKTRAAEVVCKETEGMQVMRNISEEFPTADGETNSVYSKIACYHCGKQGTQQQTASSNGKMLFVRENVAHIARACLSRQKAGATSKTLRARRFKSKDSINYKRMIVVVVAVLRDPCIPSAS